MPQRHYWRSSLNGYRLRSKELACNDNYSIFKLDMEVYRMSRKLLLCGLICLAVFGASVALASGDAATYQYDSYGRLHTVTYANGTVITYTYESAGNRQSVVVTCSGTGC